LIRIVITMPANGRRLGGVRKTQTFIRVRDLKEATTFFIFEDLLTDKTFNMKKVCGLDVHKDSIFCAIYNGDNYSGVKEFSTMTPDIYSMGEYL